MSPIAHRAQGTGGPFFAPPRRPPCPPPPARGVRAERQPASPRRRDHQSDDPQNGRFVYPPLAPLSSVFLQTRLAKYYIPVDDADKRVLEYDVHRATAGRDPGFAAVSDYKAGKLVFRRYAGLYFTLCADAADGELLLMEAIHLFVEVRGGRGGGGILFFFIGGVSAFVPPPSNHPPLPPAPPFSLSSDSGPLLWQRVRVGPGVQLPQGGGGRAGKGGGGGLVLITTKQKQNPPPQPLASSLSLSSQVYLILDEFILAGELQETSKRVILERLAELDRIDT